MRGVALLGVPHTGQGIGHGVEGRTRVAEHCIGQREAIDLTEVGDPGAHLAAPEETLEADDLGDVDRGGERRGSDARGADRHPGDRGRLQGERRRLALHRLRGEIPKTEVDAPRYLADAVLDVPPGREDAPGA
ncbi:hypothetical protein ABE10_02085, partial [Bacillus toyonensis]|nr:hypothetical protein [Bacillus toyonensis]